MDDIVVRGMAKWPNVPAVYGWLALNRRGQWLIKGELITNSTVNAFIGRNYERNTEGAWYFQNGPQRVFVNLEYTPFVYRVIPSEDASLVLEAQTGACATKLHGAWLDETGVLLVETDIGLGVIHDSDLDAAAAAFVGESGKRIDEAVLDAAIECFERGETAPLWLKLGPETTKIQPVRREDVSRRFDFNPAPRAPEGHPECL